MSLRVDLADDVCRCRLRGGLFLSTGFDGGVREADAAYNVTVPDGWGDAGVRDLRSYVDERLSDAGFPTDPAAPALLTGVAQRHARVARLDGVAVVATAGLSNPAALPVDVDASRADFDAAPADSEDAAETETKATDDSPHRPPGTVNLVVGTNRELAPGALANLVAIVAEAKAATLLATTGFPGTTSDAIVVATDPSGEHARFSGAATRLGAATRTCVRDATLGSLGSRYSDGDATIPDAVDDADHGIVTDERSVVSRVAPPTDADDTDP